MATTSSTAASPAPRRRLGWLKAIGWVFLILLVLLIILYFVATSSAFLKSVILPKVSKSLNADVTVSDASISPFKQVILRNLKVQTTGAEPLVTAQEVRLNYSLMDIIRGNMLVNEVALVSPTVTVVENPDGTRNLDPILKAQQAKPQEQKPQAPAQPSKPSKPLQVDIKKVALTDGTVRYIKLYPNANRDTTEVSHVNLTVDNVRNGQTGKLALGSDISVNNNPPAPAAPGQLQANVNGNFSFALTPDLKPGSIQGETKLAVAKAAGALAQLSDFAALLNCDITSTDIKQVLLHLQKGQTGLGDIRAHGPFDMEKTEGRILVEALNINKNLLNIAGASSGLDFGSTTINSTNEIQLAKAGSLISAAGQLNLNQFQAIRANQTTPPLDLQANYAATVDRAASNAVLNAFTLNGTQKGNSILRGELTKPMPISWGGNTEAFGESALNLAVTHFNLADWRALAGDASLAGDVNMTLKLLSQQGGKQMTLNLDSLINNLVASTNNVQIGRLALQGNLKDATPDFKNHNATGTFALTDLTGQFGTTKVQNFGTTMDLDLGMTPQQVQIRKLAGKLTQGQAVGGTFNLTGTYDLTNKTAQLNATLANFNQALFAPFLQAALGDKKLTSIALNGNANVQHNPQGASAVKANLSVTNLVVTDPKGQFPAKPLEAKMLADVSLDNVKKVAEIRQVLLGLTPTARATNLIQLTGRVDMANTNAYQGNLKLTADSLDFTSYYDLFAGQKPAAATPSTSPAPQAPAQPATTPAGPEKEAPAMTLPLSNFVAEASLGRIYLHEIEITNFLTTVNLNGGKVLVKPFQCAINGAPVNSTIDLDLGVPGYKYNVAFNAQAIPLAPFVDSFQPERKGQMGGTFTAQATVAGAGTTGASLQKNLNGQFDMGSTNLNLQVVNIKNPVLKLLVNVVSSIPELIRNPAGAATSLVSGLFGGAGAGTTGGLASDLQKSPINTIAARGVIGSGKIEIQQALVQSPAFQAMAPGTVTIAPVLTNSAINFPVTLALERSVAQKINLVTANTPTNAAYVPLPDFLTINGTVSNPGKQINNRALLGLAAQGLSGVGGKTGGVMQGLSGFLNKPAAGTNAPAAGTNQPGGTVGNVLGGLLGTPSGTATNQPPATNQSPVNNLLNRFLK